MIVICKKLETKFSGNLRGGMNGELTFAPWRAMRGNLRVFLYLDTMDFGLLNDYVQYRQDH
jgi:hypothetical protein